MKTRKIKNTILGLMLSLGILFQVISPISSNENDRQIQSCNIQLTQKLEQQFSIIKLLFGLQSNNHSKNGE